MTPPEPAGKLEPGSSTRPSPPAPARESPVAIAVDVGGTKIAAGIVRADGEILARRTQPTQATRGGEAVLQDCLALVAGLRTEARSLGIQPATIGLGVCELVDLAGNIVSEQTIKWRGIPVRERFGRELTVVIEADCRAAAFGEARLGAGRSFPTFLYVTVGTGISCSFVIDGRPYRGARGATGTMATSPLPVLCSECGAVSRTSLEQLAGGPGLVAAFNELRKFPVTGAHEVLKRAEAGDTAARRVVDTSAEVLGGMIGALVNVLDPHGVVIGGGLGSATGVYWEAILRATRASVWSDTQSELPILQAAFGADAGLIGAGLVALTT